jgi:hypothetical protein
MRKTSLLGAEDDQPAGWIVRAHGDGDAVTEDDADAIAAHAACELREDLVSSRDLDAKVSARRDLHDISF